MLLGVLVALAVVLPGCLGGPGGEALPPNGSGGGTFTARFDLSEDVPGALAVSVNATQSVFSVDVREHPNGTWRALAPLGGDAWVLEADPPAAGGRLQFRARTHDGAIALSEILAWDPPPEPTTYAGADVLLTVSAREGPHGASAPVPITRAFYGFNIADWRAADYTPRPNETFLAYLRALHPGVLRWPAGHTSQEYVWALAPEGTKGAKRVLTPAHVDAFVALCRAAGAQPLIAVNVKTGSPEAAADLVRYVNVEKSYGVRWWQIGNEPDHKDGLTKSPEQYAQQYRDFSRAMRAVDPTIRLVGGEIMTGAHVMASNGAADWITPILKTVGTDMDAVSWHFYPLDSNQPNPKSGAYTSVENLFQESARDWMPAGLAFADAIFPRLRELRAQYAPRAQVWVTEFAEDSGQGGGRGLADSVAGALWAADALGRFAAHGPDAIVKFLFASSRGHYFALLDEQYKPRPEYYTYWLYANHFGDRVVRAASNRTADVNVHAALDSATGALTVVIVNKREEPATARLNVRGIGALSRVDRYVLEGPAYDATSITLNGETFTPESVTRGPTAIAALAGPRDRAPTLHVPARSVTFLVYQPAAGGA